MRSRAYRRAAEKLSLKRRKVINNVVKNYGFTDEQVKVYKDHAINWWSNEFWADSYKKRCIKKRRRQLKNEIKKIMLNVETS